MRDIHEFRKWLDGAFDFVCKLEKQEETNEGDYIELGRIISVANDYCRRMGAPELAVPLRGYNDGVAVAMPNEVKNALGRMLAWCRENMTWPDVMTVKQAAEYLNVSAKTIRRMLDDGRLTRITIGKGGIRISRQALDQLSVEPMESSSPTDQEDLLFG